MSTLGDYACPLCGKKVKDGGIFRLEEDMGVFICGDCKWKKMKSKREENLKGENIG